MTEKLKKFIFKKLYKDLSHIEIIPYESSLWFIDRKEKYWYFQYDKCGNLWWRFQYFTNFFQLFSLGQNEFEPIISEWMEEVLNYKVNTPHTDCYHCWNSVVEVINCKVKTTVDNSWENDLSVKQVLNCKVKIPLNLAITPINFVEEVLHFKVTRPVDMTSPYEPSVEEVLNSK